MLKYLLKCALNFLICAAIIGGAAAAIGVEYRLIAGGDNKVVSYEKLNECEGRLTLGKYAFTLDLNLIDGAMDKLSQYMDSAVAYLPELTVRAGGSLCDIVKDLAD
jgi:hypothetical protein